MCRLGAHPRRWIEEQHPARRACRRAGVLAHGDRKMSVWGERYWATAMSEYGPEEFNEQRAQNRVRELVVYLEAIQE